MNEYSSHIYAVSNWHVVQSHPVIRVNTHYGDSLVLELRTSDWFRHPDGETDLAVAPVGHPFWADLNVLLLGRETLLSPEIISRFKIGVGDDLFVVGRFIDRDGVQRNQPTVRFGMIAQLPIPHQPIRTEVGYQDAFLAEIRSVSGFSGSPIFALLPPHRDTSLSREERLKAFSDLDDNGLQRNRTVLMGIDCGHMQYPEPDAVFAESAR
ncbi:MAG TPA: hypothetical protein VKS22_00670 [Candidatus Binataceae bacterium]|nr:hypothetical protein [Candidatus Binataceae bacterium]